MQDSKLISLLKTFDKEDWRWFRKFLLSPYFNSRAELLPFFDYLRKQAPDFKEKALKKEKVFKKIFPKQPYDEKQISYTMNFMLGQAERFLAQREIESIPPLVNNQLLNALVNRQLDKHYNYHFDKSIKLLQDWKKTHIDYYFFNYQLLEIADKNFITQNLRRHDIFLQKTYDSLNQFYVLNIIRHSCEMISRTKVISANYNYIEEKEINNLVEKCNLDENPLIRVYLQSYFILTKENAELNFTELRRLLYKFQNDLPVLDKALIYEFAINYCIIQMSKNNNRKYYAEQSLELYLNGIDEGSLLNQDYLSPWHFKNVIKLGLNLKKYDFTEDFIQKYHKKLEEKYQEDALHFNLADINYRKKNYQEAQIHLIQVQYSDIFYNLGAKAMLLKIYYETNEGEALFALIASFGIYLRRNKKITKETREAYLNFTNLLGKIVRSHKEKYPAVIEKINNTKHLYNRSWLLQICQSR